MSSQFEKLKNSINKEYLKTFELNLMKTSGFIPVDKRQNDFWVILNNTNLENKSQIESVIKEKIQGFNLKFIPVEPVDFNNLIDGFLNDTGDTKKNQHKHLHPKNKSLLLRKCL